MGRAATVALLALVLAPALARAHCPNSCWGHGECVDTSKCSCWSQWTGGDCSMRKCPVSTAWADQAVADETAHQPAECSARGLCDHTTGICQCYDGFEGLACNRMSCPNDCSGHGSCRSMKYHAANQERGYSTNDAHTIYTYTSNWDADKVWGCECDPEYQGYDCSLRVCPTGDDPLTTGQVNEVQVFKCTRDPDSGDPFTLTYKGETTVEIPVDSSADFVKGALEDLTTLRSVNVLFHASSCQTVCCDDGSDPNPVTIEFLKDFGDLAHILSIDENGDHPAAFLEFAYDTGNALDGQNAITATKEADDCSNRGWCDTTKGICTCYTGYETSNGEGASGNRGDCGFASSPITECPGVTSCSGHGVCSGDPEYRCTCDDGWMGGDCREQTCPCGKSWFDHPTEENNKAHDHRTECSNKGHCNRETGTCECHDGFEGEACQRLSCPKDVEGNICSGHGKCLTMKQLAEYATDNGDETDWSYGFTPNDPQRWDYQGIMGCFCDTGYQGHDCTERVCPTGDDVTTTEQDSETVIMECQWLDDSTPAEFTLKFRQETTSVLTPASTADEIKAALEALNTIETVSVVFSRGDHGDTACMSADPTYDSNYIEITFLTETGDLPDITEETGDVNLSIQFWFDGTDDSLITDADYVSKRGTRENSECSERGLCDHTTGQCNCFVGFGSSDHQGNRGGHADCGFRLPIVPTIQGFSEHNGVLQDGATGFNPTAHADVGTDLDAFQVIGP